MEAIVRKAFSGKEGQTLKVENARGNFYTYCENTMWVKENDEKNNRSFMMKQKMTWLGKVSAQIEEGTDCYEGINEDMVTKDGNVDTDVIDRTLKATAGLIGSATLSNVISPEKHPWRDNHVALIINLMRFAFVQMLVEENTAPFALYGAYPFYSDGHVSIEPNQFFNEEYQICPNNSWPTGEERENYPIFAQIIEAKGPVDGEVIDLRGMSVKQAKIVLMMTAAWKRKSRYRLDFTTPKLAEKIYFRADARVIIDMSWAKPARQGQRITGMPAIPNADDIWRATMRYVDVNRLWAHFSTALYMISSAACQMVPQTAETQIWLDKEMLLTIPAFHSFRGRYEFFNAGRPGQTNPRALSDWVFVGRSLDKVATAAMVMGQVIYFGLGIRAARNGIELEPEDLRNTEDVFSSGKYFVAAAVAECLRIPVTHPGMEGARIEILEWDEQQLEVPEEIELLGMSEPDINGYDINTDADPVTLRVHSYSIPGIPVLALPLSEDVIPSDHNPFKMRGKIVAEEREYKGKKKCWSTDYYKAYEWAVLSRWCGWDTQTEKQGRFLGAKRFYAPNDSSWTWPLVVKEEWKGEKVVITGTKERDNKFITLPYLYNKYYKEEITWWMKERAKGTAPVLDPNKNKRIVEEDEITDEARAVLEHFDVRKLDPRGWATSEHLVRGTDEWKYTSDIVFNIIPQPELEEFMLMANLHIMRANEETVDNPPLPHNA